MFSVRNSHGTGLPDRDRQASTSSFAQGGPGAQGVRAGGSRPQIRSRRSKNAPTGMKKIDGFFPLYWDENAGKLWLEIPKLDTEVLYSTGLATGLGSNDIGLDRGMPDRLAHRQVRARRAAGADGAAELPVPRADDRTRPKRRRCATPSRDRCCGASRSRPPAAAACSSTSPSSSSATGTTWPARLRPGSYRFEATRSRIYAPDDARLSEEHRDGSRADVRAQRRRRRRRRRRTRRRRRRRRRRRSSRASAASPRRAEAASIRVHHSIVELPDAGYKPRRLRSALRLRRHGVRELRGAARPADDAALHPPPPAAEEGSVGGDQRAGQADHLLPRSRRARADPLGAARRRALVEPGVRGGRLSQRVPRRAAARGRRARSTSATTSSTGCTARRAAGAPAAAVTDPRTGEIIKGDVTLGSLRIRQDYMIAEGLLSPYKDGTETPPELTRVGARAHPPALGARGRPHARASATTTTTARPAASR